MNIATRPRPTPHQPGAFSYPHSPGPLVQIIFCASVASLRPLYGVIRETSIPWMSERTDMFLGDSEGRGRQWGYGVWG